MPLRVAAISFLNPAPLLYNFTHEPAADRLRAHYDVHFTSPSRCAAQLHAGQADLGLIPIAELTPALRVVPGCTIASLRTVRSILLLVRSPGHGSVSEALRSLRTVAADTASRSSVAYTRLLLDRFYSCRPQLTEHPADPLRMLAAADAALLIGDPALVAREHRQQLDEAFTSAIGDTLLWLDVAELWHEHTGLPWVAAVWAVRPEALASVTSDRTPAELTADLLASRDAGLAHIDELVAEWTPRLPVPPATIRTYLTRNIYYRLDQPCLAAIALFRQLAAEAAILPPLPVIPLLS